MKRSFFLKRTVSVLLAVVLAIPTMYLTQMGTVEAKTVENVVYENDFEDGRLLESQSKETVGSAAIVGTSDKVLEVISKYQEGYGGYQLQIVVPAEKGKTYKLSYQFRCEGASYAVQTYRSVYHSENPDETVDVSYDNCVTISAGSNDWRTVEYTYTMEDSTKDTLCFYIQQAYNVEVTYYIDDVVVTCEETIPNLVENGDFDADDRTMDLTGWNLSASKEEPVYETVNVVKNHGMDRMDDADYPGYARLSNWEPRLDFITMESAAGVEGVEGTAVKMISGDGTVVGGVNKRTSQFIWDWQTVTLEENKEYTVSFTGKAESANAIMFVQVLPTTTNTNSLSEEGQLAKAEAAVGANAGTWQTASATFNSGSLTEANVMIVCYDGASVAGGDTYYLDDISLTTKKTQVTEVLSDSVIKNGDMSSLDDAGYPGYARLSNWEPRLDFITMESAAGVDGVKGSAVKMVSGDGTMVGGVNKRTSQFIWDWQTVTLEENKEYTVSFTGKAESANGIMFVQVLPTTTNTNSLSEEGQLAKAEAAVGANAGTWQTASATFNSGSLTEANVMIVCYDGASMAGGDTYYVDDVSLATTKEVPMTKTTSGVGLFGAKGDYAAKLEDTTAVVDINMPAGKYDYSYDIRMEKGSTLTVSAEDTVLSSITADDSNGNWTTIEGYVDAKADVTELSFAATGTCYIDNVDVCAHIHKPQIIPAEAATCTKPGKTQGSQCSVCDTILVEQEETALAAHKTKTVITKASYGKAGTIKTICTASDCRKVVKTVAIAAPKSVIVANKTYNGKSQTTSVVVKDTAGKEIKPSEYTVSGNKATKVGKYTVTVTFKNTSKNYQGKITGSFVVNPKGTKVKSVKGAKKSLKVTWTAQTKETTGYKIQVSTDKKFKKNVKTIKVTKNKTTSKVVKGLKAKKNYYVRICTCKGSYTSAWSAAKSAKTK